MKKDILNALRKSWLSQSSSKWSLDNPAKGQCGVTSLVVQDILGGEIRKTFLKEGWHFYNVINGIRMDFTEEQFSYIIDYQDIDSNRNEAFHDTNDAQYSYLKSQVYKLLGKAESSFSLPF
ncbi:hypothetical protein [Lysinibacillus sp. Y5S-8]|uniref:YunG family protein n=1 Tax=Lysinibacillus sp. Y5S-8 TaxID=3122488 RepID=UPI0030D078F9